VVWDQSIADGSVDDNASDIGAMNGASDGDMKPVAAAKIVQQA
jgi:hypothetical protein